MYMCPYCYWDTANIKFACQKETDLDSLIHQLKDSTNKGLLKKMYDHVQLKLKENEGLTSEIPSSFRTSRSSIMNDMSYLVNKAMEIKTWDVENLEEKILDEEKKMIDKNTLKYEDNYYSQHNNYCAFNAVASLLSCGMDYSEKMNKIDSIESLKDKLRNDYEVSFISSLDQRLSHVTFQNSNTSVLFPKFVDLIPKKSKRCKFCKKFIVQAQDSAKSQKLELCHLFLNQFPYCYIFRVEPENNTILLKFVIFDFKETIIAFEECIDSEVKVLLPTGVYEMSDNYNNPEKKLNQDQFIFSKSDRCLILKFKFDESFKNLKKDFYILRFKVKAEYVRLEAKHIEYISEIKFKI